MARLGAERWALVKRLYENSELTVAEIAVFADVAESSIYQHIRRNGWTSGRRPGVSPRKTKERHVPATGALLALEGAGEGAGERAPGAQREAGAPGTAAGADGLDRAGTARRLWHALDRHLEELIAHGAPEGQIRTAQNLATLARTLQSLVGVERELAAEREREAADEGPDDIDEFRNEISRRLEGLLGRPGTGDGAARGG